MLAAGVFARWRENVTALLSDIRRQARRASLTSDEKCGRMTMLRSLARAVLPASARQRLRQWHRDRTLERAVQTFRSLDHLEPIPAEVFDDLSYGWGNSSWSARLELIETTIQFGTTTTTPLLECGSGLSTVILGLALGGSQTRIWSLENDRTWLERTQAALDRFGITGVRLLHAPLRDYGGYQWYTPPLDQMPAGFGIVVCDGPPGSTPGGRGGLVPVMGSRLLPGCRILLDDIERAEEQATMAAWARTLGTEPVVMGSRKPFGQLTLPG